MKKVLLASTALVAISGAAFAQGVSVTGFAEMGVAGGSDDDAAFHQDIDVTFKMESMTDAGLTFGTAIDIDEVDADGNKATNTADHGGVAVYVKGPFGNVTLGDTDGGFDWAMSEVAFGAGSIADNHTGHAGYGGHGGMGGNGGLDGSNDGQILRYDNSFGDLGVALSYEQGGDSDAGDTIGIGVKGSLGDIDLGVGFQQNDEADIAGASVTATFGSISGAVNFSNKSYDMSDMAHKHIGVGATYSVGATSVNVNFGQNDKDGDKNTGFGVAAQYGLGGGADLQFGYGNSQLADDSDSDSWSLGLAMSF